MFLNSNKKIFIIAEAGVNHDGDIDKAIKLVEAAKESGCDAVKFQTFDADRLVCQNTKKVQYQTLNDGAEGDQYSMLKRLMLTNDEFLKLHKACNENKIEFLSTPYDPLSVKFLDNLNVRIFKVASADIIDPILNHAIADTKKKVIISTGMSTLEEIKECLSIYRSYLKEDICLLHCVSNYPCSDESLNLRVIPYLKENFNTSVGFSDHTTNSISSSLAIAMGSEVIEKHFTLDKQSKGPDHKSSLEPDEMENFVKVIRKTEVMLGSQKKSCQGEEYEMRSIARKKIILNKNMLKDDFINIEDIDLKRTNEGLEGSKIYKILNKQLNKNILKNTPLTFEDFY